MIPACVAMQRPADARLAVLDEHGAVRHVARATLAEQLRPGDLLVVNDAATLPASLRGRHVPSGSEIEVRLAARVEIDARNPRTWRAVVFGEGDHRTPTERRALPPPLRAGDALALGPLHATIQAIDAHPRLVRLRFEGSATAIWEGLARHGRPVQYAHLAEPLAIWDTWTRVAGPPVALEPPSAGFVLDWALLGALRARGVEVASLTHAAGLSSTGDAALDALLPLDEPYTIPAATALAVRRARREGRRIVALGTTVARALESAARGDGTVRAGAAVARNRLGRTTPLRIVDAIVSGTHERGTSHYALLEAFATPEALERVTSELDARGYRTHEFGDSVLVELDAERRRKRGRARRSLPRVAA